MLEERDDQERPCFHCMMVELIDNFIAEYPAATGEPDAIDTDEVVTAIAKTMAELTCGQDGTIRQQLIEQAMRRDEPPLRKDGILLPQGRRNEPPSATTSVQTSRDAELFRS